MFNHDRETKIEIKRPLAWGAEEVIPSEAVRKSGTAGGREEGKRREGRMVDCVSNQQDEWLGDCYPSTICQNAV
ncbi:hypothetical protein TNCT_645111 [Trichonephila clavata]|uniref:Uncharacterized protein n=1 Tax=Trichonephila clavata TaxID=2740835 RepID=A0A8X6GMY4_TRICU|nr:hypothetical protein TNCT_645111 [Trichonephila clavata]